MPEPGDAVISTPPVETPAAAPPYVNRNLDLPLPAASASVPGKETLPEHPEEKLEEEAKAESKAAAAEEAATEDKGEAAGEPTETEDGEAAKEETDEVDWEALHPKVKNELARLRANEAEQQKRMTQQGRMEAAAKAALKDEMAQHQQMIAGEKEKYEQAMVQWARNQEIYRQNALALEQQSAEAAESGNAVEAQQLSAKAQEQWREYNNCTKVTSTMQRNYDHWEQMTTITQARQMEDTFLESFPEFKEVKGSFEAFCNAVGSNPLTVKTDFDQLHRMYTVHLNAERGKPENIEKIRKGAEELAIKGAAAKRGAGKPPSATSSGGIRREAAKVPNDFPRSTTGKSRNLD